MLRIIQDKDLDQGGANTKVKNIDEEKDDEIRHEDLIQLDKLLTEMKDIRVSLNLPGPYKTRDLDADFRTNYITNIDKLYEYIFKCSKNINTLITLKFMEFIYY